MNFPESKQNVYSTAEQSEQSIEQQEKIESLATSLENVLGYLQYQNNEENAARSDLFKATGQSLEYLVGLLNNLDILKAELDVLKAGMLALERSDSNQAKSHKALQQGQEELRKNLASIKETLRQPTVQQLEWKQLALACLGVSLMTSVVSGAGLYLVTSTMQSKSTTITEQSPGSSSRSGTKNTSNKSTKAQPSR
jgi:hypothetical protein